MASPADRLLVELAVKNHLISQAEADGVLAELAQRPGVAAAALLVDKKLLKERHVESLQRKAEKVLAEQQQAAAQPALGLSSDDATFVAPDPAASPLASSDGGLILFGQLAIKHGFLVEADLERALRLQEQLKAQGTPMRTGEILVRAKRMTTEQVHEVLRFQEKWVAACAVCNRRYNVHGTSGQELRCPQCGGPVGASASGVSVGGTLGGGGQPTVAGAPNVLPNGRLAPTADDPAGLLGLEWKGYRVEKVLGKGGMGAVYKAVQASLRRPVALKVMLRGAGAAAPGERERFEREAKLVGGLRHPNIVPVFTAEWDDELAWFTMELVAGKDFKAVLRSGASPIRKGAEVVVKAARAMDFAHQRGVIHRDLKPQNIMVDDESGEPKILDFGLAKNIAGDKSVEQLTQMGAFLGTPAYMAPEQAGGDPNAIDHRADVYALGAILYEVLTGRPPFTGKKAIQVIRQVLKEDPVPCREVFPQAPAELEAVAMKALRKDPDERYQTAGELADAIEAVIGKVSRSLGTPPELAEGGGASGAGRTGASPGGSTQRRKGFLSRLFGGGADEGAT